MLAPFAPCFNKTGSRNILSPVVAAWIVCLGRRTISRVWQTTGLADEYDHSSFYRFFNQAVWNWDELARIFLVELLRELVPGTKVWIVVDDTLCHKRGAKVAFGGTLFLDAVPQFPANTRSSASGLTVVGTLGPVVQLLFSPGSLLRHQPALGVCLLQRGQGVTVFTRPNLSWARDRMVDLLAIWLLRANISSRWLMRAAYKYGRQTPPRLASERPGGWPDPPQKPI